MIFGSFGEGGNRKPEMVPDETLIEVTQNIVTALDLQIDTAKNMADSMPNGEEKFRGLLEDAFFYGYVFGLCFRMAAEYFPPLIEKEYLGTNGRRLLQCVIANLLYRDCAPDWNAVQMWDAQAASYGITKNADYQRGENLGAMLGEEIISGPRSLSVTLLGAELLRPDL